VQLTDTRACPMRGCCCLISCSSCWGGSSAATPPCPARCGTAPSAWLALADRLGRTQGVAWTALLVSVCVPLCNVAAVWPLPRHGGHGYLRDLTRNPLIIATLSGLLCNLAGVRMPALVDTTLGRVGAAALPLGLMAVGAGLQIGALRESPRLAAAFLSIRHALLPALALLLVGRLGLPPAQQAVVVAFAALPTASSAYGLAARMGGSGPLHGRAGDAVHADRHVGAAGMAAGLVRMGGLRA